MDINYVFVTLDETNKTKLEPNVKLVPYIGLG